MKNSIQWLNVNDYNKNLEISYHSKGLHHEEMISLALDTTQIKDLLVPDPFLAEIEDVGLTATWFAKVNSELFYIMNFTDSPFPKTIIGAENFEILAHLTELAPEIYKYVRWINKYPEMATYSVFVLDENGANVEVYRAEEEEEALSTALMLNYRGKTDQFFVDKAENLRQIWLVMEKKETGDLEIGRYIDRLSAENFAIDYAKKEQKDVYVKKG
jgi:hypothetical protein